MEEAAASMGAGRMTIARRITFPLAALGMIAAAIFSFITCFDEFYISQFLSSVGTITLPVQVYNSLTFDIDPSVTAVSAILIAVAVLALALVALVALVRWLGSGRQNSLLSVENTAGITNPAGETYDHQRSRSRGHSHPATTERARLPLGDRSRTVNWVGAPPGRAAVRRRS
ncbi:ABC transporter permease [Streptomyces sp. NPDC088801]|uniref:ABC transporter permease n=1 Tax=Streptomyces sp. NPDC088801 TaxID=3365903 RepID=UPI00381DB041